MSRGGLSALCAALGIFVSVWITVPAFAHAGQDRYVEAGARLDKGDYTEALALYQGILQSDSLLDDQKRSKILNNIGYCHYKLNHLPEARDYYNRALKIAPDYPTCLNNMAAVLINERRFAEAVTYLDRAYRIERTVKVVFNLFAAHYYMDHRKEALAYVEEALRLDGVYTESRLRAKNIKQRDIDKLKGRIKSGSRAAPAPGSGKGSDNEGTF